MCSIKPLTCGVCYYNPTYPILTNTTEKYIDLGQREAFYSSNHIHVSKAVVSSQGVVGSSVSRMLDNYLETLVAVTIGEEKCATGT